jgi:hypothetical protein
MIKNRQIDKEPFGNFRKPSSTSTNTTHFYDLGQVTSWLSALTFFFVNYVIVWIWSVSKKAHVLRAGPQLVALFWSFWKLKEVGPAGERGSPGAGPWKLDLLPGCPPCLCFLAPLRWRTSSITCSSHHDVVPKHRSHATKGWNLWNCEPWTKINPSCLSCLCQILCHSDEKSNTLLNWTKCYLRSITAFRPWLLKVEVHVMSRLDNRVQSAYSQWSILLL